MDTRRSGGFAAVELAVVTPIFLLLLMATAEFGHALYQYNTLTKAVRDAAQYLARYGMTAGLVAPTADEETAARCLVVYGSPACPDSPNESLKLLPGMDPGNDVTFAYEPPAAPTYVKVTANYTYVPLVGAVVPSFGTGVVLSVPSQFTAEVRMRGL
jgi:hypothetical protein